MSMLPRIASVLALAGFMAGCAAPTPQARIARHPEDFASLSSRHQSMVQSERIERGMPANAVYFAWGSPDRVGAWVRNGVEVERWTYFGYRPVYYQSFGWGYGWGYLGHYGYYDPFWYGGSDINYVPYAARTVDFRGGRVVNWEARVR
jgi:hypothetical protein